MYCSPDCFRNTRRSTRLTMSDVGVKPTLTKRTGIRIHYLIFIDNEIFPK